MPVLKPAQDLPTGLVAQGLNSHGYEEVRNERDGSVLVLVPGGSFTMGSADGSSHENERPLHAVDPEAFYIGRTEVTNAQFRRFAEETGYDAGPLWGEYYAAKWGDEAPLVAVSWHDANAYCRWAGLRLPTEAEWEKAARGTDGRRHPWGDSWVSHRAWHSGNSENRPHLVGFKPGGASPYGVLDMAGNVWEWTSSLHAPYPYDAGDGREDPDADGFRVVRGGSWSSINPSFFRGAYRSWEDPSSGHFDYGFRCALSSTP